MESKDFLKKLNIQLTPRKVDMMFKADINFLPRDKRFYFYRYIVKTVLTLFLALNIAFVLFIWIAGTYSNVILEKRVKEKKKELRKVTALYETLLGYDSKYRKLLKELGKIRKEIERVKGSVFIRKSAYASTAVFFSELPKGMAIKQLEYKEGQFFFTGSCDSESVFWDFYRRIETSEHIRNARFFYIKKQRNGEYSFRISVEVRY